MAAADVQIPSTYKALVYDKPGELSLKLDELKTPEPGPGEVLIKLFVPLLSRSVARLLTSLQHPLDFSLKLALLSPSIL